MSNFAIKKGLSTSLFNPDSSCRIQDSLELYAWYLTTDTAEVYVCLPADTGGGKILKKLNDTEGGSDSFDSGVKFITNMSDLENVINPDRTTLYVVEEEDATYRWTGDTYACVGVGFNYKKQEDVRVLFGGTATGNTKS